MGSEVTLLSKIVFWTAAVMSIMLYVPILVRTYPDWPYGWVLGTAGAIVVVVPALALAIDMVDDR